MDTKPVPSLAASFLARLKTEGIPRIEKTTVAFYGVQDEQIKRDRTGVLYTVAGLHFILTASHSLRQIVQNNIPLFIDRADCGALPIPIADAVFHSTEEEGRDVAAIRLSDEVVQRLRPHKEFLTHADVLLTTKQSRALYLLFGYPELWSGLISETAVRSYGLAYTCLPYDGERNPDAFFDEDVHVLLGFDQAALCVADQATQQLPRLHGVSGCGIWRMAELTKEGLQRWRPEDVCLVALQHRWFPQRKYIQGTWLGYALALIRDNYPSVSSAMELVYPRRQGSQG
jgi:hypothetical protein